MSALRKLALTIAAHNHLAVDRTELDSIAAYQSLKARSASESDTPVSTLNNPLIPSQYDYMQIGELVAMVEAEASQLAQFGAQVLDAAKEGLLTAVDEGGFEMDATRWDFKVFAENHLEAGLMV